ncbi:enamelin [Oreochromis niloticus]|uniref:enamelin n=1 Tax=Oreochromis niloticus TaxID=8128 RepID=UPI00022B4025|nr:nischarin [Oreochromis niloticus]
MLYYTGFSTETVKMKQLVFFICLLVSTLAAPAPASESSEIAAHANEALRWMEMYRLYQQQGIVQNPFVPSANSPAVSAGATVDAAPAQPADVPPPAHVPVGDASEEETEDGNPATKAAGPAPLNSDEVEEAEEVEAAEADPAMVEAEPSANPAAVVEPAVVDVPIDVAPVDDAAAVDVPPVDVVPVDSAPAAPEVAVDPAAPATADILAAADVPAEVDAGATDVGAAPLDAEANMTGGPADPTAL